MDGFGLVAPLMSWRGMLPPTGLACILHHLLTDRRFHFTSFIKIHMICCLYAKTVRRLVLIVLSATLFQIWAVKGRWWATRRNQTRFLKGISPFVRKLLLPTGCTVYLTSAGDTRHQHRFLDSSCVCFISVSGCLGERHLLSWECLIWSLYIESYYDCSEI